MINVKNYVKTLEGKPVAVFGLGASGLSCVRALVASGASVTAWDDRAETHKAAKENGAKTQPVTADNINSFAALVLAPGVPLHGDNPHPVALAALSAGVEIIGDIEILHRSKQGRKTIGVTGTNGKSTTVTLIAHILKTCGVGMALGGNIGTPVLDTKKPATGGAFVLELSSFQIDLSPTFAPDIAILLNVTPDHIDRHGSVEEYAAIKERIFANPKGAAIIGVNDDPSIAIYERLKAQEGKRVIPVCVAEDCENGVYVLDGVLFDAMAGQPQEIGSLNSITTLQGTHNQQNVAAAYAAAKLFDIAPQDILEAIRTYPGLAHRQFPVRVINGVAYINDSKATNAEAAGKALACNKNIYWILGGRPKDGGLSGLEAYTGNIKHAFLIGEAAEEFADWLEKHQIPHHISGDLGTAVLEAHAMAQAARGQPGGGGAVLLSPAAASYDQFRSFEHRGDAFTELVNALDGEMAV